MAVDLLKHAIDMILKNLPQAIRASAVPLAILLVASVLFGGSMMSGMGGMGGMGGFDPADPATFDPETMNPGRILGAGLFFLVAYLLLFGWLAVMWHRYILLGEEPSFIPSFAGKNIGAYIGQLILLGLILIGLGIAIGLVGAILSMGLPALSIVVTLGMVVILGLVYLRLALTLPAVAVGERLGLGEAWSKTKPFAGTFIGIFFLLALLRIVAALPGVLLASIGLGIIGTAVDLLASWFTLMVGVGILTTLYGHIVEGRPLN